MANVDEKAMAMVEKELEKNPDMGSSDLFEKVKAKHASVADLTVRQFHARYPLQVKRRKGAAAGTKKRTPSKTKSSTKAGPRKRAAKKAAPRKSPGRARTPAPPAPRNTREAVRGVLMRFATELASVEAKADVVKVLAGADRYVDEVIDAVGS